MIRRTQTMPRDGLLTPRDLVGKLEWLVVVCDKCGRKGRYSVARLVRLGPVTKLTDWLSQITADCPKRRSIDMSDQCGAHCPDLSRVFRRLEVLGQPPGTTTRETDSAPRSPRRCAWSCRSSATPRFCSGQGFVLDRVKDQRDNVLPKRKPKSAPR
jgi:hypothetical protein